MNSDMSVQDSSNQKWGFAGTLIWGLLISLLYIIIQVSAVLAYAQINYGNISEELLSELEFDATALSLATISTLIICNMAVCGVIKLKKNSSLKSYLALNRISLSEIRYWVIATIVLIIVFDTLTYFLGKPIVPEFMSEVYNSANHLWLLVIALVVAAPVFEELFFRGFLISGLSSTFIGPIGAILLSSISWAAVHLQYDLYGMFMIFVAGILLGVARLKTNSLFIPILMHATMNMVAIIEAIINAAI